MDMDRLHDVLTFGWIIGTGSSIVFTLIGILFKDRDSIKIGAVMTLVMGLTGYITFIPLYLWIIMKSLTKKP